MAKSTIQTPQKALNEKRTQGEKAIRILTGGMIVGVGFLFAYSLSGGLNGQFSSVLSVSILVAGVALFTGGLLGFLFRIPKTIQSDNGDSEHVKYVANTNLEQISDWLTKIIVGVGLAQLGTIHHHLDYLGNSIAPAITVANGSHANVVAIAILLYFSMIGFLIGFLWTRLYLATAFKQADLDELVNHMKETDEVLGKVQQQIKDDSTALSSVTTHLTSDEQFEEISFEELKNSISKASKNLLDQIFVQARELRRSSPKKSGLVCSIFRALIDCDEKKIYHKNYAQLAYALNEMDQVDYIAVIENLTKAIDIRDKVKDKKFPLYEYLRAHSRIRLCKNDDVDESLRKSILSDLKRAKKGGEYIHLADQTDRAQLIRKWLKKHQLSLD